MVRAELAEQTLRDLYAAIPHLLKLPAEKVWIDYDQEADVLYLSLKRPQRATDTKYLDDQGVLLRYRGQEIVGITVLDASKRGGGRKKGLPSRAAISTT